jgi:predicted DNA-binding protein with PD1-like motif
MKVFALRLIPDQDLHKSLKQFVNANQVQAGFMLTAVGSLKQAAIRFANQNTSQVLEGKFEIISLAGTLSIQGIHLHIALADQAGQMMGGHLSEGCLIYTTAEIVIGESKELRFDRKLDQQTGFKELTVFHQ